MSQLVTFSVSHKLREWPTAIRHNIYIYIYYILYMSKNGLFIIISYLKVKYKYKYFEFCDYLLQISLINY